MKILIYDCGFYCDACAPYKHDEIRSKFPPQMTRKQESQYRELINEQTFDSEDMPGDFPDHCSSGVLCAKPIDHNGQIVGCWLETPLTEDGITYMKETLRTRNDFLWSLWEELYKDQINTNPFKLKLFSGE